MSECRTPAVSVRILREREAKTSAVLREIDSHLQRLQVAKQQREIALARIRVMLALQGQAAPECDDD